MKLNDVSTALKVNVEVKKVITKLERSIPQVAVSLDFVVSIPIERGGISQSFIQQTVLRPLSFIIY